MIPWALAAASVVLAALLGFWLGDDTGRGPEPARTAFLVSPAALARGAWCPDCRHLGDDHDPDLGCTVAGCPCRRLGCGCPGSQA